MTTYDKNPDHPVELHTEPDTETSATSGNKEAPVADPRTLAEERLAHLSRLQSRMHSRGGPERGQGRDGRSGQGRVLALLLRSPEISQRELTFLLGLSRQALAELLPKLEHTGFIERTQSEADRRVVLVKLTEAGREAATQITARMQQPSPILEALDDQEVRQLAEYLGRIIESLEVRIQERREERRRSRHDHSHEEHSRNHPHGHPDERPHPDGQQRGHRRGRGGPRGDRHGGRDGENAGERREHRRGRPLWFGEFGN